MNKRKNTKVKCSKCGKEEQVNFEECLGNGFPKCCGYTMTMIYTKANIERAVVGTIRNNAELEMSMKLSNGMVLSKVEKLYEGRKNEKE